MNQITKYRREFHRYAETGWNEVRTSARIAEILAGLGAKDIHVGRNAVNIQTVKSPIDLSEKTRRANMERAISQGADPVLVRSTEGYPGVVAVIDTGHPGPVSALRFDIDCLPYDEKDADGSRAFSEDFSSVNPGCVHACGHDGHTAIGLGLASDIIKHTDDYRGVIKLLFQPAEETFFGAASIVDKGFLDDVDHFIAVHLALSAQNEPLPSGSIACGINDFLSVRQLDVTFHGRAAHPCGAAQEGRNALLAACSAALSLHAIAPHEKGLTRVNVGMINGGLCANTIPPECSLRLEYRGQFPEISQYLKERVFDILGGTAKTYGLTYTFEDYGEVPAARSDSCLVEAVRQAASRIPWFNKIYAEGNLGGSDDASVMMNHVQQHGGKAVYIGIGTDISQPVHNPGFDFDEDCLEPSVSLLSLMLKDYL